MSSFSLNSSSQISPTSNEQHQQFRDLFSLANFANNIVMPSSNSPSSSSPSSAASIGTVQAQPIEGIPNLCGLNMTAEEMQKMIRNIEQQKHCQNAFQKHLLWEEEERQRRKQALLFNKAISHEKRKFTQPISDFMVKEVLKRKSHLVEHNTSRDLKFSEEKRKAWETVRDLLKERFAGFNMGIENIKSHWRYRKRKVSDAANEMRGPDAEEKLREKLGNDVDFDIYLELKASNMLEHYDDDSPPMPLMSNGDEIGNAMLFGNGDGFLNGGISDPPPFPSVLFDGAGQSHQNQQPQQNNGTMAQNGGMTQLNVNGLPPQSLFSLNVIGQQLQNLLKARQQEAMTDSNANSNGNQPISAAAGVNGSEQLLLGPLNANLNGQLNGRDGRKRAADSNGGELIQLINGIQNGQYKARKKNNDKQQENGDSDAEAGNNDEIMVMECSMNKKRQQHQLAAASTSSNVVGNGMMLDMGAQNSEVIQAQIAAAISQKEAADYQKVVNAELLLAAKNFNELLPKMHAVLEKWMEGGSKN